MFTFPPVSTYHVSLLLSLDWRTNHDRKWYSWLIKYQIKFDMNKTILTLNN